MNNGYELIVDLPGFKKDEVHAALENGYLTISAEKGLDKDEKDKETGRYIRRERYAGACSRSSVSYPHLICCNEPPAAAKGISG